MTGIPTHKLGNVISLDEEKGTVFVEPNVTMGQLTATIMPLGESATAARDTVLVSLVWAVQAGLCLFYPNWMI
jgi:hypothetical protein